MALSGWKMCNTAPLCLIDVLPNVEIKKEDLINKSSDIHLHYHMTFSAFRTIKHQPVVHLFAYTGGFLH